MKPEDIGYLTDLQGDFSKELKGINSAEDFQAFLLKWKYWLDDETKSLSGTDWGWMKPLVDDCRRESTEPEEKHQPAIALLMPECIFKVSIVASQFHAPWGTAYIRMKEMGHIDY